MMGFFLGGYDGDNYLMKTTVYFTVSLGEGIHPNLSPTVRCFFWFQGDTHAKAWGITSETYEAPPFFCMG